MKTLIKSFALAGIAIAGLTTCKKEYFQPDRFAGGSYEPTVALPLLDMEFKTVNIMKKWQSDLELEYDPDVSTGNDSVYSLQLVYSDTLDSLDLADFEAAGIIVPITVPFPTQRVNLRIFGDFPDGSFRLTNPSVAFHITNTTNYPFELEFRDGPNNDLYTQKEVNGQVSDRRDMEIIDPTHPYQVPGQTATTPFTFVLNNDNIRYVDDPTDTEPMAAVLEPTPKYLYYGVNLTPQGTGPNNGGQLVVAADVILPMEGYGNIVYRDTVPYSFIEPDEADQINYAELRLITENGLPLEAIIEATVYDSSDLSTAIMKLPFYEDGNPKSPGIVAGAAPVESSSPYRVTATNKEITDIGIYNVHPQTGAIINDVEKLARGNRIIITATLQSTNAAASQRVKMYSDYSLKVKLSVKAQANLDLGSINLPE